MRYLNIYVRQKSELYPASLADSVHLSYSSDGIDDTPLNQNYGILFARAVIRPDNSIEERRLIHPVFLFLDGMYGIAASWTDSEGTVIETDKMLLWTTRDFISFKEHHLVERRLYAEALSHSCERIEISEELEKSIRENWLPVRAVETVLPEEIKVRRLEDLKNITATVVYSDGSTDEKKVQWDIENPILREEGRYTVYGNIVQKTYEFPLAAGYADPVIFKWENDWYFIATNDNKNSIGLYVRKADCVDALFSREVKEYCILDYDEEHDFVKNFWAPEFHQIGQELYLLFSVGGKNQGPQSHMMRLKPGGSIINSQDWESPVRVCRQDGSALTDEGITIDMTYFCVKGRSYVIWNCRKGFGTQKDTGGVLLIASVDEKKPWILTSEPVVLSRSLYGWENNSGTLNNEGPYPLILQDYIYISYSGGAANGYSYAVGFLRIPAEANMLDPDQWEKIPAAALSSASIDGIQGPGHNSFFVDDDGKLMIAYHAQEREKYFTRCTMIHRVHINRRNVPVLNLSAKRDLPDDLKTVTIEAKIQECRKRLI